MESLNEAKRGDKIVKLININGMESAALATVAAVCKRRGLISTDENHVSKAKDIEDDGVCTYRVSDGRAAVNYIPGCSSRLVRLEGE